MVTGLLAILGDFFEPFCGDHDIASGSQSEGVFLEADLLHINPRHYLQHKLAGAEFRGARRILWFFLLAAGAVDPVDFETRLHEHFGNLSLRPFQPV